MSRSRFVLLLILIAAVARFVFLTWLHPLNWDEIEFFRATDWVRQGLVPYRDFWEHHPPLQWFLFAPVAALTRSPAAAAIIGMRWAQIPLWVATLWLVSLWMRECGMTVAARLTVIALVVCSSMFMTSAVEYRVDTLGCLLYFAALVFLQRMEVSATAGFAAGAALCLIGFANLRLDPLLVLTIFFAALMQPRARSWGRAASSNAVFLGTAVTGLLCSLYFFATGTAAVAFRRTVIDNYYDTVSETARSFFFSRLAAPFGFDLFEGRPRFDAAAIDLATIVILMAGTIGLVRVVAGRWRRPDSLFFLAILQICSVAIIASMKFVYPYHFEIVLLMMLPFVGLEIDRFLGEHELRWGAIAALLIVVSAVNVFASLFRGDEADLAYQDRIMREAGARTPRGSAVFDGVGWALRRRPAYRYWFLPGLIVTFEAKHKIESYGAAQMAADPPAAIITDYRAFRWIAGHGDLAAYAVTHYLPLWRNLWLPAMSGRLGPSSRSADWVVPQNGTYRIYGSPRLVMHPWFDMPLIVGTLETSGVEVALTGFPPAARLPLAWSLDGVPIAPPDRLVLRRGARLHVDWRGPQPIGLMIVPDGITRLFRQPPPGVSLDGVARPATHTPRLPDILLTTVRR